MIQKEKTVRFKIVYCGTPLSGKTTNLRQIHAKLDPQGRSDLVSLSTAQDRTLFFDFLAVESAALPGFRTRFHLYTVPGQVTYNASTFQLVLRQADGVVFSWRIARWIVSVTMSMPSNRWRQICASMAAIWTACR